MLNVIINGNQRKYHSSSCAESVLRNSSRFSSLCLNWSNYDGLNLRCPSCELRYFLGSGIFLYMYRLKYASKWLAVRPFCIEQLYRYIFQRDRAMSSDACSITLKAKDGIYSRFHAR